MLYKILKIVVLILSVLGAVWLLRIISAGDEEIKGSADLQASLIEPMIYLAYAALAIILIFLIIFVVKNLITHPKQLKSALIGLGVFALIVAISWALASGVETPLRDGEVLSASASRWVETGLYVFYILAIVAIAAMVFSSVKKVLITK